ncbi:fimbrial protein [Serratia sp. J2]|uniref:fimbrial protein n=1 Tax=Serratia sp. J2 TaxID=3386551 RepID=UPI0039170BDE
MKQIFSMKTNFSLLGGLVVLFSNTVQAQVTCQPYDGSVPRTDTIQLAPMNISAGVDMPNGTMLYRGSWFGGTSAGYHITCTTPTVPDSYNFTFNLGIATAPLPLASWTGSPFGGKTYQSGIPGIGVAINDNGNAVTIDAPFANGGTRTQAMTGTTNYNRVISSTRYINLVKIGPIAPGSYTLSAANLPTAKLFYDNAPGSPNVVGFPIISNILKFQGTLTVSAQTCATPDVVVPLGSFDANKTFTGVGTTTLWVKTNLALQNCPTFYGYYNNQNVVKMFDYSQGGASTIPASTSNNVGIRLVPNTSVVNAANGIMAIDASSSSAASGVGIQLGWGDVNPTPFNLSNEQLMVLPKDGSKNIAIPLSARYIQTASTVTPGRADGKVTFTINYY